MTIFDMPRNRPFDNTVNMKTVQDLKGVGLYPYTMDPKTNAAIESANKNRYTQLDIITGKWNYYKSLGKYGATEEGLRKASADIAADMASTGYGTTAEDVFKVLSKDNFFSVLSNKVKTNVKAALTPPSWLLWGIVGVAVLGVMFIARPYASIAATGLSRFRKPQAK